MYGSINGTQAGGAYLSVTPVGGKEMTTEIHPKCEMNLTWHNYLRGFCDGFGTTDPAQVSNASYVGKTLLGLWMPPDYQREGKAGVFSTTVIRELYLLDLRGWKPSGGAGNKPSKEIEIGQLLSRESRDEIRLAAVYLSLRGGPASVVLEIEEEIRAKAVVCQLQIHPKYESRE